MVCFLQDLSVHAAAALCQTNFSAFCKVKSDSIWRRLESCPSQMPINDKSITYHLTFELSKFTVLCYLVKPGIKLFN